jgi:hypothetical protein
LVIAHVRSVSVPAVIRSRTLCRTHKSPGQPPHFCLWYPCRLPGSDPAQPSRSVSLDRDAEHNPTGSGSLKPTDEVTCPSLGLRVTRERGDECLLGIPRRGSTIFIRFLFSSPSRSLFGDVTAIASLASTSCVSYMDLRAMIWRWDAGGLIGN